MSTVFRFLMLALAGLMLTACVNKEPEQRAAFIAWLQSQVTDGRVVAVPPLDRAQRQAFGDYADQYEVLADFDVVARRVAGTLNTALERDQLYTLAQLMSRHEALVDDRQALARAHADLADALSNAQAEIAELEQPPDVQKAYAPVYQRVVIEQAASLDPLLAVASAAAGDALRVAEFVERHRDQMVISAESASVRDPSVQREMNDLLEVLNGHAAAVSQAQGRVRAMMPE